MGQMSMMGDPIFPFHGIGKFGGGGAWIGTNSIPVEICDRGGISPPIPDRLLLYAFEHFLVIAV